MFLNLTSKIKERLRKIKERLRKFKERKISRKSRSTDQGWRCPRGRRIGRRIGQQRRITWFAKGRLRAKIYLFWYSYWKIVWQRKTRTETDHLILFTSNPIRRHYNIGSIGFFHHAWIEYQVSGKTNVLQRYTSGLIFAQLSAKHGIKKYGREAKLQVLAEFKQLV